MELAYKQRFTPDTEDGRAFFNLLREYTMMGYYTSRVGMQQLDWPGLKFYTEPPGLRRRGPTGGRGRRFTRLIRIVAAFRASVLVR